MSAYLGDTCPRTTANVHDRLFFGVAKHCDIGICWGKATCGVKTFIWAIRRGKGQRGNDSLDIEGECKAK